MIEDNLSAPDFPTESDLIASLPQLPCLSGKPVFSEPWQARVFGITIHLFRDGHFTWQEWVTVLSEEINTATGRKPAEESHYYHHWLTALERLITSKGLVSATELLTRKEALAKEHQ